MTKILKKYNYSMLKYGEDVVLELSGYTLAGGWTGGFTSKCLLTGNDSSIKSRSQLSRDKKIVSSSVAKIAAFFISRTRSLLSFYSEHYYEVN